MKGCRRCVTDHSTLLGAENEVRRIARQMSRASRPKLLATLKEQLMVAKANLSDAQVVIERGHDCDTRLVDEHWMKAHG